MVRFMILTFAVLGWGFYELSGGSAFAPPDPIPVPRLVAPDAAQAQPGPVVVASYAPARPVMAVPAFAPQPGPEPLAAVVAEAPADTRKVVGSRVNMRSGPGTGHPVLTVLARGEAAEVLETEGRWARIRSGAAEGWMALSMLSDPA
jgi:hypothetical protein